LDSSSFEPDPSGLNTRSLSLIVTESYFINGLGYSKDNIVKGKTTIFG